MNVHALGVGRDVGRPAIETHAEQVHGRPRAAPVLRTLENHVRVDGVVASTNTVAVSVNVSPTTALAGQRPQPTAGSTSVMGMRPIIEVNLPVDAPS